MTSDRLEREAIARIIDPDAWATFDTHQAAAVRYIEIVTGPVADELADHLIEASHEVTAESLAKADQVLALLPTGEGNQEVSSARSQMSVASNGHSDAEPSEWVLVPREPTEEMLLASEMLATGACREDVVADYQAMIEVAPIPTGEGCGTRSGAAQSGSAQSQPILASNGQTEAEPSAAMARALARIELLESALTAAIEVADQARGEWDAAPQGMKAGKLLIALSGHLPGYRASIDAIHAALSPSLGASA